MTFSDMNFSDAAHIGRNYSIVHLLAKLSRIGEDLATNGVFQLCSKMEWLYHRKP